MEPPQETMGKFMDLSQSISQQEFCEPSEVLYGKNTTEAMAKSSSKQLTDYHTYQKDDFQDQLRASTQEAMAKNEPLEISHPSYSDYFHNIHDGDEFSMDAVTMGGPVDRPIKKHTSDLVMEFFLTHAPPLLFPSKMRWL
jgi:hypothetical protein